MSFEDLQQLEKLSGGKLVGELTHIMSVSVLAEQRNSYIIFLCRNELLKVVDAYKRIVWVI